MKQNIFLIGMPGSGKTTLGKQLAEVLEKDFIDLDEIIEKIEKRSINQIFEKEGESKFREIEHQALISAIAENQNFVMATGGGAACFFDNLDLMKVAGITVYLDISSNELLERLKPHIAHRPLLRGKSDEELLTDIKRRLENRRKHYEKADIIVRSDNISLDDLLQIIERKIQG